MSNGDYTSEDYKSNSGEDEIALLLLLANFVENVRQSKRKWRKRNKSPIILQNKGKHVKLCNKGIKEIRDAKHTGSHSNK